VQVRGPGGVGFLNLDESIPAYVTITLDPNGGEVTPTSVQIPINGTLNRLKSPLGITKKAFHISPNMLNWVVVGRIWWEKNQSNLINPSVFSQTIFIRPPA
jgi:hypothetical protein